LDPHDRLAVIVHDPAFHVHPLDQLNLHFLDGLARSDRQLGRRVGVRFIGLWET
jgi:hypothetical protein